MCVSGVKENFQEEVTFKLKLEWSRDHPVRGWDCALGGDSVGEGPLCLST